VSLGFLEQKYSFLLFLLAYSYSYFKIEFKNLLLCEAFPDLCRWNNLLTLLGCDCNFFTHLLGYFEGEQSSIQTAAEQMARFSLIQGFSNSF
jgi:hypothetical protein